jgi:hypothetical protein
MAVISQGFSQAHAQDINELVIPKIKDDPIMVAGLINATFIWEVEKSFGIFAYNAYHTQDQVKLTVKTMDIAKQIIMCNYSTRGWFNQTWFNHKGDVNSSNYIIPRHWGQSAARQVQIVADFWYLHPTILFNYFSQDGKIDYPMQGQEILNQINENATFRQTVNFASLKSYAQLRLLDTYTKINYDTIFWNYRMITIVTINIDVDDKNFIHFDYTQNEGIMLSQDVSINIINGSGPFEDFRGSMKMVLIDFEGYELKVSPWHYVLWVSVVVGSIFVIIVVLSILINRRQRRLLDLDY